MIYMLPGRRAVKTGRRVRAALVLALALFVATALPAGADAAAATQPTYLLGPGDAVDIVVYGQADLSETVTIKPDGMIALPLVGEVKAAGRTTVQLEQDLAKAYLKYLKAPAISVKVSTFRTTRIYVLGQVFHPGQYELKPSAGILELLAAAGGPTTRADLAKAVLIRGKSETTQLDLVGAIKQSKEPGVSLEPEDVLYIPETDARIVVLGQVNRPGAYDLLEGQRVTDLIAGAGGPTTKAALGQAFVVRDQQQIPVDLKKALDGDPAANIVLQPRDMMVIPENRERIAVLGAVNRPGPLDFKPDMKLVDAIALAGGETNKANLARVQIIRVDDGKGKTINVDFNKVLHAQDPSQNVALQNGDIVYVSQKGFSLDLLGGIVNIYYLLRSAAGF